MGYNPNTAALKAAYTAAGAPGGLNVCEGEHWDGQDSVNSGGSQPAECGGAAVSPDPNNLHVNRCMGSDPNSMASNDATNPLGVRVSASGSSAYTAVNIADVGRAVLFVDDGTVAVYLRDNTITNGENVLATAVSAAGITRGTPGEADCDQAVYHAGAVAGDRRCTRDNTAITVEHELLA